MLFHHPHLHVWNNFDMSKHGSIETSLYAWYWPKRSTIISNDGWPFNSRRYLIIWCRLCKLGVQSVGTKVSFENLHKTVTSASKFFRRWVIRSFTFPTFAWGSSLFTAVLCAPLKRNIVQEKKTAIQVVHLIHGIRRAFEQVSLRPKMEAPMKHKNGIALHGVLVILHLVTAQ